MGDEVPEEKGDVPQDVPDIIVTETLPKKDLQVEYKQRTMLTWLRGNGFTCAPVKDHEDLMTDCKNDSGSITVHVPKEGKASFGVEHEDGAYRDTCVVAPLIQQYSPRRSDKGWNHITVLNPTGGMCSVQVQRGFGFKNKYMTV